MHLNITHQNTSLTAAQYGTFEEGIYYITRYSFTFPQNTGALFSLISSIKCFYHSLNQKPKIRSVKLFLFYLKQLSLTSSSLQLRRCHVILTPSALKKTYSLLTKGKLQLVLAMVRTNVF